MKIIYIYIYLYEFMYSAFEQALSMKRALYKFGIIIISKWLFTKNYN